MTRIPEAVRLFAEEPDAFLSDPLPPSSRIQAGRFTLFLGPTPWITIVSGVRVEPAAVPALVDEVRLLAGHAGHGRVAWVIGPSTRPAGLAEQLATLGFVPADRPPLDPSVTAMALTRPPEVGDTGSVVVRKVESLEDFRLADGLLFTDSGVTEEELASFEASATHRFESYRGGGRMVRFLAFGDGVPVAAAQLFVGAGGFLLGGSATLPEARGRGAYRALVRARWDEAVRCRKPALVIQAGVMSRPILERVGFERVCELVLLLDPVTDE